MKTDNVSVDDPLLKRHEAADMLRLRPQTLAAWAMTGRHLSVVKIGRTVRYHIADVRRLVAEGSDPGQA